MSLIQSIKAEKTVAVTELRKKPCDYFIDEPVAVLSNNKTAGYMIRADLYEQMLYLLEQQMKVSHFRPSQQRLLEILEKGEEALLNASDDTLTTFTE